MVEAGGTVFVGGGFTNISRLPYPSLAGVFQSTVSVGDSPVARLQDRLHVSPNPSAGRITLQLTLRQARAVEVTIYDLGGRIVRRLGTGAFTLGEHPLIWDGRDGDGWVVRPGLYLALARGTDFSLSAKVLRSR